MKHLPLIILILAILTACGPNEVERLQAETALEVAETESEEAKTARLKVELQAEIDRLRAEQVAQEHADLIALIERLLDDAETGRASLAETNAALLDLLEERQSPSMSPYAIACFVALLGVAAGAWFRRKPKTVTRYVLSPGTQVAGSLGAGEQWTVEVGERVREVVEV